MNSILDDNLRGVDFAQLRKNLIDNGFVRTYGDDKEITVEESDTVKVKIKKSPTNSLMIEGKIPSLGNPVQIAASVVAFLIFFLTSAPYGLIWAVLVGWAISYFYYRSKIDNLKKQVWRIATQK